MQTGKTKFREPTFEEKSRALDEEIRAEQRRLQSPSWDGGHLGHATPSANGWPFPPTPAPVPVPVPAEKPSIFQQFGGYKITDFYKLGVDKQVSISKAGVVPHQVKIFAADRALYAASGILGKRAKQKLHDRLEKKYIKPYEVELQTKVAEITVLETHAKVEQLGIVTEQVLDKVISLEQRVGTPQESGFRAPDLIIPRGASRIDPLYKQLIAEHEKNTTTRHLLVRLSDNAVGMNCSNGDLFSHRNEVLEFFANRFSAKGSAYRHIPYISLECDARDIQGVLTALNAKLFEPGDKTKYNLSMIEGAQMAGYAFIPELAETHPVIFSRRKIKNGNLWNLDMIGAYEAQKTTKGDGITIAIVDTGVDYTHPDLEKRFDPNNLGYNVVEPDAPPMDDQDHGTAMAGVAAGRITGVAPLASLRAYKVLNSQGFGSMADVLTGIEMAYSDGADIISLSLGGPKTPESAVSQRLVSYIRKNGGLVIASAGNDSGYSDNDPAHLDDVISVAAVDEGGNRAYFSTINDKNSVSCPGVEIPTTARGGGYLTCSGTSPACPHASGTAALAKAVGIQPDEYEKLQNDTVIPRSPKSEYGFGILRADRIVNGA